ncbi:alpha/beta hydrolase [Rhodococcus sp. NPDC058521]|uniref:alpha/beta hydrolase n=1 Tax=Rhodococcus sp. NPDC058521 TaxID=3346536 RepID=UPI00365AB6A4
MSAIQLPTGFAAAALRPFFRLAFNSHLPISVQRILLDLGAPLQTMPDGSVVRKTTLAGRPVERITVGATRRKTAVLFLHGGAYTVGSLASHRSLAAHLSRESGSVVYLLDYRLAPENPFPAGLEDAEAAYLELVTEHGYTPDQVAISGDSAGGGLTLATAERLVHRHGVTPAALGLIAPWADPTDRSSLRDRDVVINTAWAYDAAAKYLGGGDPSATGYAPLHDDLSGLPPTIIHIGLQEVLYPQAIALRDKLKVSGVDVRVTEFARLWHVAHAQASLVREARDAVADLGKFLGTHLSGSGVSVEPGARNVL